MKIETTPTGTPAIAPAFDPKARDRIELIATKLLELYATLESRLHALEQRQLDMEDALRELGQEPPRG